MFKRIVTSALVFGTLALAPPAQAQVQNICGTRGAIIEKLKSNFHESAQGAGLQSATSMIEVWSSEETGSWTILMTRANGMTCVIASGMNWQSLQNVEIAGITG